MSVKEKVNNLKSRINEKTAEITKQQILAHNKDMFQYFFEDPDGPVFVHPRNYHKKSPDGKEYGYIYNGVYDKNGSFLGVHISVSDQVEYVPNKGDYYRNLKQVKNENGKKLFSLDELVKYDYEHTEIIWKHWLFDSSERKNKRLATKQVLQEVMKNRLANFKKNQK